MLKNLITNLLDDDEGITSDAYSALLDYLASIGEHFLIEEVNNMVKSSDGRYYFPSSPQWQSSSAQINPQKVEYVWKDPSDPKNW